MSKRNADDFITSSELQLVFENDPAVSRNLPMMQTGCQHYKAFLPLEPWSAWFKKQERLSGRHPALIVFDEKSANFGKLLVDRKVPLQLDIAA